MKIPEEVSLEGYQWPLEHDELYGLWFPRLRTMTSTFTVQSTPEYRQVAAAAPPGVSIASFGQSAIPMGASQPPHLQGHLTPQSLPVAPTAPAAPTPKGASTPAATQPPSASGGEDMDTS